MKPSPFSPHIEILEARIAPAVHTWIGGGADNLWSNAANWNGGSPATDASGDVDLVFPTNAAQLVVQNDIAGLVVDSITFSVGSGTSANGYTINGSTIFLNTGAAGQNPFGIDVAMGVADPTNGITQTFNLGISLFGNAATFRTTENGSRLTFHGDINLALQTLTIDNAGINNANTPSVLIDGDILTNGNLIKNSGGTLQLLGENSFANITVNNGVVLADTDTALGSAAGTIQINDPGKLVLRNGVTVVKTLLNLNSNALGGGLGADGNTTNTFRGPVVLFAGAGGVALGAGIGVANANTRLVIDGVISGATSTLSLNGAGVIEFTRDNSYTGLTNHNGNNGFGALQIDSPGGLGAAGAGNETQLNRNGAGPTGSALWVNFNGAMAEQILFAGSGVGGLGAIRALGDSDVVLTGNITHIAGAPWAFGVDDGSLTTTGVIDSQGANRALTKVGAGTLVIDGAAANTYLNGTIINGGIVSVENSSASPLGSAAGVVTVNNTGTLRVEAGITIPNAVQLNTGGTLTGFGTVGGTVTSTGGIISPGASVGRLFVGNLTLDATSTFVAEINGATPGTTYDQVEASGSITLGGAKLSLPSTFTAAPGTFIVLLKNNGASTVSGNFGGLPEGTRFVAGGQMFSISYVGGDGNDVVLTTVTPLSDLTVSTNGRTVTYTDSDGDLVTVKTTKGALTAGDFTFAFAADNRQQLQRLALDAADVGTNLTITAKRSAAGGDGFANVGFINAVGVDLGTVSIDGDLGQIDAGAVKSLTVQSLGALGLSSQAAGGSLVSNLTGNLGKLTVKASIHGATILGGASIGAVTINGSFLGGQLSAGADLGAVSVRGDIIGTSSAPVVISGFGKATEPKKGPDIAIKSLKVGGGVEFLRVLAGYDTSLVGRNADGSTGAISVGTDWRSSNVLAGVGAGADGFLGTVDDGKLSGGGVTRDQSALFSTIAGITIKGQAFGSIGSGDTFGVVAEQITKAKIGKATLKFDKGERDATDAFAAASTGPGATGLASDFFLREITV